MKVIVASFQCESNSFTTILPDKNDFEFFEGECIYNKMPVKELFIKSGIDVVPCIYANALPSGIVPKELYTYYSEMILEAVRANDDADGMFIYFHGSMEVDGIGSGELELLKNIRKIVSKNCKIALALDLHANICEQLNGYAQIICGYKTAPHTDQNETQVRAVNALIDCLKNTTNANTVIIKVPMIIKGDTMLTAEQPLKDLIKETIKAEKVYGIYSANLFFGHCWVDANNTSASVVVSGYDNTIVEKTAKWLADSFWKTRNDYNFKIENDTPENSVKLAISGKENRIFITDSGDNTTAGAEGNKTKLLKLLIGSKSSKSICVAGIMNPQIVEDTLLKTDGSTIQILLDDCKSYSAEIVRKGKILGWAGEIIGNCVTLKINNIDVIFTEKRSAFIAKENFVEAGANLTSYNIVVVKLGYLFSELKPFADREIFALTDGASCVEVEKLYLKNIVKPMFPINKSFDWQA